MTQKMIDITGQRFGRLVALSPAHRRVSDGTFFWLCRCDCGHIGTHSGVGLRMGDSLSCGCARRVWHEQFRQERDEMNATVGAEIAREARLRCRADEYWRRFRRGEISLAGLCAALRATRAHDTPPAELARRAVILIRRAAA